MFIVYIRRHGWRHSIAALLNFLILVAIIAQIGGLVAIACQRPFYENISIRNGFTGNFLFGFRLVDSLLNPAVTWALVLIGFALIIKEFYRLPLSRRLAANGLVFLVGLVVTVYMVYVLYALPIQSAGYG